MFTRKIKGCFCENKVYCNYMEIFNCFFQTCSTSVAIVSSPETILTQLSIRSYPARIFL